MRRDIGSLPEFVRRRDSIIIVAQEGIY